MHKSIEELTIADLTCCLYLPPDYDRKQTHYPVIYINGEVPVTKLLAELKKMSVPAEFLLLSIKPQNWNDDFTPWTAPAFRNGETAPKGNADAYIEKLITKIKPYIDDHYRTKREPEHNILLGYSLGGLAALYTLCKTNIFAKTGSLSGSLWYDGFIDFMENQHFVGENRQVYLSLGKKEAKSQNARMGQVAECTRRMQFLLEKEFGKENVTFEWNNGGHFHEIPNRFAKALRWLLQPNISGEKLQ